MKKNKNSTPTRNEKIDLPDRISLVMQAYEKDGHVNRKTLMAMYGLSQVQAGVLMRDFIHAHAINLEWHPTHSHYKLSVKSEKKPVKS